jgi:Putative zinc-finger
MTCHDAEALMDDLVDGTLAERERRELAGHLETCVACRSSEARMRALLARARALPGGIEPPHDLWPAIAGRLPAGTVATVEFAPARRRWYVLGAAAVAAVLIAAVSLTTAVLVWKDRESRMAASAGRPGAPAVTPASLELAPAQATYAAARVQLLAALQARRATLSPQTLDVVEKNLRIIDRAVAEMQAALARDPGNREIPSLLVATYQQEVDLLQRVTSLPGRG